MKASVASIGRIIFSDEIQTQDFQIGEQIRPSVPTSSRALIVNVEENQKGNKTLCLFVCLLHGSASSLLPGSFMRFYCASSLVRRQGQRQQQQQHQQQQLEHQQQRRQRRQRGYFSGDTVGPDVVWWD